MRVAPEGEKGRARRGQERGQPLYSATNYTLRTRVVRAGRMNKRAAMWTRVNFISAAHASGCAIPFFSDTRDETRK